MQEKTVLDCQKRNQQFNWHGDFVFHPKLKLDTRTLMMAQTAWAADVTVTYRLITGTKGVIKANIDGNVQNIIVLDPMSRLAVMVR